MVEIKRVPAGPENVQITVDPETARALLAVAGFGMIHFTARANDCSTRYANMTMSEVQRKLSSLYDPLRSAL